MPMTTDLPAVERPQFFDGERLTAGDLLDAQTYERELRWLHNRCLHSWGVAVGLAVHGRRAATRSVTVGAGLRARLPRPRPDRRRPGGDPGATGGGGRPRAGRRATC